MGLLLRCALSILGGSSSLRKGKVSFLSCIDSCKIIQKHKEIR